MITKTLEDNFLVQRKAKILAVLFVLLSTTGTMIFAYEVLQNGLQQSAITQGLGTLFILITTADFFVRKSIYQSTLVFTVFTLVFLTFRYLQYGQFLAPSVIWFTALPPSLAWITGKKTATTAQVFICLILIGCGLHFFHNLQLNPNRADLIYLFSAMVISSYLTYIISDTQALYYHHIEEKIQLEKQEMHQGQLASLGELAGNIAHEINNPLQVIKGNSSLLSRKLKKLKVTEDEENLELQTKLIKYAKNIDRTVDRTRTIIESLLKLAKKPEDNPQLSLTSLSEVWNQAYPLLESKTRDHKASISFFNMEKKFYAQPEYLAQILLNLVGNSLFEISDQDNPWIRIEFRNDHIDIVDSGHGLTEEVQKKILAPFYTTKGNKGTGLGLPLCSALMKQMGGSLEIPQKQDHTTFRLILPKGP